MAKQAGSHRLSICYQLHEEIDLPAVEGGGTPTSPLRLRRLWQSDVDITTAAKMCFSSQNCWATHLSMRVCSFCWVMAKVAPMLWFWAGEHSRKKITSTKSNLRRTQENIFLGNFWAKFRNYRVRQVKRKKAQLCLVPYLGYLAVILEHALF